MLSELVFFCLGLLCLPFALFLIISFNSEISKRKRFIPQEKQNLFVSECLKKNIEKGLIETDSVSWLNVIAQRFYNEIIKNYAFENRVKKMILKNFVSALKTGIIKDIKIMNIDFGKEAPYFNSIRILSRTEMNNISNDIIEADEGELENLSKIIEDQLNETDSSVDELISKPNEISFAENLINANIKENMQILSDKLKSKIMINQELNSTEKIEFIDEEDKIKDSQIDDSKFQDIYKHLVCAANIEYHGGINVSLEIELPKNIFVNSTIYLKEIKGTMLFRIPAENYDTRFEYTFLKNPKFNFEVESGIKNGTRKIFFQGSINNFLKKAFMFTIRKTIVFPNWFQHLQGFLPSIREIDHKIIKYTAENLADVEIVAETIQLYMSADYKILYFKDGIFFRRFDYNINIDGIIKMTNFKIPKHRQVYNRNVQVDFQCLDGQDSRFLSQFVDMNIFEGILSKFKGLKNNYSYENYSMVTLIFHESYYHFLRIIGKDFLIFQRNDPQRPDFFAFKISNKSIYIYSYNITPEYEFTERRIEKLKKKVYSEPLLQFGSNIIYKMMHFGKKNIFKPQSNIQRSKEVIYETNSQDERNELEDLFYEALNISDDKLDVVSYNYEISKDYLISSLKKDSLRIKLFTDNGRIRKVYKESERIKTIIVEDFIENNDFNGTERIREIAINSYYSDDFIIDMMNESNKLYILRVEEKEHTHSILHIISKNNGNKNNYSTFLEAFQLQLNLEKYNRISQDNKYEIANLIIKKDIKTSKGGILFEFFTEYEDDFQLKFSSCKKGSTIFEIYKVISSNKCTVFLPTEDDFVKLTLVPKFKRNMFISYKIVQTDIENELFVDSNIGLNKKEKFMVNISGNTNKVIFWDKDYDDDIKTYIENTDTRITVEKSGILREEDREYRIIYKNKENKKRNIKLFLGSINFK